MNIHESAEDYLERVLMIRQRKGVVYSIDIVHELNFSKPSVSVAMKRLRENGYIQMDADGAITLLPPGWWRRSPSAYTPGISFYRNF